MADPLHLPPEPEPQYEQVRLGNETLNLAPEDARVVRDQFEALAAQYGAQLEELRRQALQSVGTPYAPQPYYQPPYQPEMLAVPDPDLLFKDKNQWTDEFGRQIEQRIGNVRGEAAQLVSGAVNAFQQELNRRDAAAQARAVHDRAMEEMLERRGLTENTRIVQAIYNEQYDKLKHLPLELGLDKIGQLAEEEITRIRSGEKWTMTPGAGGAGVTQRPPATLRTVRRAPRPAAPPPESPELLEAGGGLGAFGKIIRTRQAQLLGMRETA